MSTVLSVLLNLNKMNFYFKVVEKLLPCYKSSQVKVGSLNVSLLKCTNFFEPIVSFVALK